ncbi:MAG: GH39 family glycosyl hydrolase, partial [Candidatus Limnocylindrales bacterium]
VKVLAILDDQTVWAARRLCPGATFATAGQRHGTDFGLGEWQQLVSCVARQFAGRISAYEIWNEPLLPGSMFGYQDGTAAHYADLLRVASTAIKAADPTATVIALGGSDLYAGGDAARLADMRSFTNDLLALGAARYADAISLHAYPWGRADPAVVASYQAELRFQAQAWGKPVWITETGTRATDPGTQGTYAQVAYGLLVGAGVRHIFWFSITDQPDGAFGLRGRPVEATLRAFALAHP